MRCRQISCVVVQRALLARAEYSEEIYPYATFHVPPVSSDEAMSTKLQTFVYRGVGAELLQGAACRHAASPPATTRPKVRFCLHCFKPSDITLLANVCSRLKPTVQNAAVVN